MIVKGTGDLLIVVWLADLIVTLFDEREQSRLGPVATVFAGGEEDRPFATEIEGVWEKKPLAFEKEGLSVREIGGQNVFEGTDVIRLHAH